MTVTVGATSPLASDSRRANIRARKKAGTARLSAARHVDLSIAPCRAVGPVTDVPLHRTCTGHGGHVEVPFETYLSRAIGSAHVPCRAEVPREFGRKAAHSSIASSDSDGVHVPPGVFGHGGHVEVPFETYLSRATLTKSSVKEEGLVPPMPPDAIVKEEGLVPPMPSEARWSDATVKEEDVVVKQENEIV